MKKILMVEGSTLFAKIAKDKLEEKSRRKIIWVKTIKAAQEILENHKYDFYAAILDYNLPDGPNGEIISVVANYNIPSIVFTANVEEKVRNHVWENMVVDYVLKENPDSLTYIAHVLDRLSRNKSIKILVVDDTDYYRKILTDLLTVHRFKVFQASNGEEALALLKIHPEIMMTIIDYNMPKMNGIQLTHAIRSSYSRDQMAIIGISAYGDNVMAANFIKNGASDFIIKQSFLTEEFYCRVNHNLDNIENIKIIRETATKDYLTKIFNRRYFIEAGRKLFASAKRENIVLSCAMIDIDHFKDVNDTYGHEAGDIVLQQIAIILSQRFRETDIVSRFGGEEFCILAVNLDQQQAKIIFTDLLKKIESTLIDIDPHMDPIKITISIGVTTQKSNNSLEEMIKEADSLLYESKSQGRNRVTLSMPKKS